MTRRHVVPPGRAGRRVRTPHRDGAIDGHARPPQRPRRHGRLDEARSAGRRDRRRSDPIPSFYGMVSRMTKDGSVFVPEQRLTRAEALRAYTLNNAFAAFMERELGSITPGKYADVVVLTKDIMTIPEREIPTARVLYTIVGGAVKYQRSEHAPVP
ncbi:MAG: amidohydrolase family protein [bacterium]